MRIPLPHLRPNQLIQLMPIIEVIPVEANRLKLRDELPTPASQLSKGVCYRGLKKMPCTVLGGSLL